MIRFPTSEQPRSLTSTASFDLPADGALCRTREDFSNPSSRRHSLIKKVSLTSMELVAVLIVCGIIGAMILSPYNKAGLGCLAGGLLGPLGIIAALIEKSRLGRIEDNERHTQQMRALASRPEPLLDDEKRRSCPFCAERILAVATVCRFCGREISSTAKTSTT